VTVTEYPDPAVPVPGTLRVDIALSPDNAANRHLADARLEELRPAGIYIDRQWADGIPVVFRVELTLAAASLPVEDIKSGIRERLTVYAQDLGPGDTLRKARIVSLILQDNRIADARVTVTVDGTAVAADTYVFPAGKVAALDPVDPVVFGPIAFQGVASGQPVSIQVDAAIAATSLTIPASALETFLRGKLQTFTGSRAAGVGVTFDAVAGALRDDTKFAMVRSRSTVTFDAEGGGFTELRDNGPAFTVPPNSAFTVRNVRVTEDVS
jgi:hypothetical protein